MRDQRFDRAGELGARQEVLRVRRYEPRDGVAREELSWKGPTEESQGYKARRELTAGLATGESVVPVLAALDYRPVHAIDRWVEHYQAGSGVARLEWYPDLDTLIEIEGDPPAIERLVAMTGIARTAFSSAPLDQFVRAFAERVGRPARLALAPGEIPAQWPS